MDQFCKICATTCTLLEDEAFNEKDESDDSISDNEVKFKSFLVKLPRPILERIIPETLKIITNKIRKNRTHKGVLKAVQCLPQKCVQKLDFGSLFGEVRLYGHVNISLKKEIKHCLANLPNLVELNLSSKCTDEMLIELAKHCKNIEILGTPISDITDRGLLALCGISYNNELSHQDGCFQLVRISVQNCDKITAKGVGCLLRNLPKLQYLYYDRLIDAVETVIKLDGDYLRGSKCLNIHHIDQFCDFYDFESHPDIIQAVAKVCPKVTSFRFFISDEGCRSLDQFPQFHHLQLEMSENISSEFEKLTQKFGNLVTLHLTFRRMPHHALLDLGGHCPHIEVVKLIGYGITSPNLLQPNKQYFQKLKIFETRMVRSDELLEQQMDEEDLNLEIPITPEFVEFFLINSLNIQDITISAMMSFLNETFLMRLFDANPMGELQRLCISPLNKITSLTSNLAFNVIMSLPNLHTIALSRWKMTAREIRQLRDTLKSQNFDVNIM